MEIDFVHRPGDLGCVLIVPQETSLFDNHFLSPTIGRLICAEEFRYSKASETQVRDQRRRGSSTERGGSRRYKAAEKASQADVLWDQDEDTISKLNQKVKSAI